MKSYELLFLYCLLLSFIPSFNSLEAIASGQSMKNNETLISAEGTFEAGFFSTGKSNSYYFGIWYKNIVPATYVWVANRDTPLANSSAVLRVTDEGNILLLDATGTTVWSSNTTTISSEKPVLQLLESGNLVVIDGNNAQNLLWQSFDHPSDTLLAGQKLESNLVTGEHNSLTSWRDINDPSSGEYSLYIDPHGLPQLVMAKDSKLLYRAGPWNGLLFTGVPWERLSQFFNFSFGLTDKEAYYEYALLNTSIISRYVLIPSGLTQRLIWSDQKQSWDLFVGGPTDQCDNYDNCGANSICNISSSRICGCLEGFIPRNEEHWKSSNWSEGCVRRTNLSCNSEDGFQKYTGMQIPDTSSSWFDRNMTLEECEQFCLTNCSCTAYTNLDVTNGGTGCLLWFNNIVDVRKHLSLGQDLYIRLAASELDHSNDKETGKKKLVGILAGIGAFLGITILGLLLYLWRNKLTKPAIPGMHRVTNGEDQNDNKENEDIDLPMFDFSTIANATDQFSFSNKLGEGGFGPVYKGALGNGQEIAVKRLSKQSGQGVVEFKNEVILIANLQHRNLVKLLGCCIQDEERLLVYEFMHNRSLDHFIFDQTRRKLLNWNKCFQIINGIARGLLYLHQDSRQRIIHRDFKTSNILLDKYMNPKISDFGLARTFVGDYPEGKTIRVAGTHGYMSPEYAVYGSFSIKLDVFSFGVIVLEIISGRRNSVFYHPDHHLNLLGHAWKLWSEGRSLELMDESVSGSVTLSEVARCIHTGLLCVQERPDDRPDMSSVVLMLNGEKPLAKPREPGFYPHEDCSSSSQHELSSINETSMTLLEAR